CQFVRPLRGNRPASPVVEDRNLQRVAITTLKAKMRFVFDKRLHWSRYPTRAGAVTRQHQILDLGHRSERLQRIRKQPGRLGLCSYREQMTRSATRYISISSFSPKLLLCAY